MRETIPEELRQRLDALAGRLHVTHEWVPPTDPRCRGRDFGFYEVRIGPDGWQDKPRLDLTPGYRPPGVGLAGRELCVQGDRNEKLESVLRAALVTAERRWPGPR